MFNYAVCKGCGQPIIGNYITALGATWHPEHFVCAGCGQPIADLQFTVHQNAPYHLACYERFVAPRCAYCNKPLIGRYLTDYWGTAFCAEHVQQYPRCDYCGRLVSPWQQEQSPQPGIGTRCPICRSSAVEDIEVAKPLYADVKRWVGRQGLTYRNLPLKLDLCGPAHLASLLQGRQLTHTQGATESITYTEDGHEPYTEVRGVAVLRGLPSIVFQGVTVHELGHVWLIVQGVRNWPAWMEEGFCELLSYRFYQDLNTPESCYHVVALEQNQHPIYGDGFRRVKAIADAVGFQRMLEVIQTTKQLPAIR